MLRIGINIGRSHTDAVLMDNRQVVSWVKIPSTPQTVEDFATALEQVLASAGCPPGQVGAVMVGLLVFSQAVETRRHLNPVAVIRLGWPAAQSPPPLSDWPEDLHKVIGDYSYILPGGHKFDGRPLSILVPETIRRVARQIAVQGIRAVAVTAVFSPVNPTDELTAAEILASEIPEAAINLSHTVGSIGFLERENATVLNASLRQLALEMVQALQQVLADRGITAPLYLTRNSGTLMSATLATEYPVFTLTFGAANSIRGASVLSGLQEAVVVDVGSVTTHIGRLRRGFPQQSSAPIDVEGVRVGLHLPAVRNIPLGGDSIVRDDPLRLGPDGGKGLVFGGDVATVTDMAVAAGLVQLGDPAPVHDLDPSLVSRALMEMRRRLHAAIEQAHGGPEPQPVILVGGGSTLLSPNTLGLDDVLRPEHHLVAGAVGAASAPVGGEVDRVFTLGRRSRQDVLEQARREAVQRAVLAGADPVTVCIVDVEEKPLTYLPSDTLRLRVKAIGEVDNE